MYRCEVCKAPSPKGQPRIVYKGVALCKSCSEIVAKLEKREPIPGTRGDVAALVAREIIASFEQPESSASISWPRCSASCELK